MLLNMLNVATQLSNISEQLSTNSHSPTYIPAQNTPNYPRKHPTNTIQPAQQLFS